MIIDLLHKEGNGSSSSCTYVNTDDISISKGVLSQGYLLENLQFFKVEIKLPFIAEISISNKDPLYDAMKKTLSEACKNRNLSEEQKTEIMTTLTPLWKDAILSCDNPSKSIFSEISDVYDRAYRTGKYESQLELKNILDIR